MTDLQISNPQYNLLYSAFSFPNIFLTLVGGFMIDFLGVRFGIFCFCTGVLMAQLVVAIGGTFKVYLVMLVGRAFFGICSENLIIA
jgi:MFS family permease